MNRCVHSVNVYMYVFCVNVCVCIYVCILCVCVLVYVRVGLYLCMGIIRATGNSRFEGDKFPVIFWKNPENSRLELMTYLLANTFIIARKWPKLTHFYQLHKTQ